MTAPRTARPPSPTRATGGGIIATLRVPSFGAFWVASLAYFIVFGMQQFALVWLTLELSDSAPQASVVASSVGLPALVVSLPAGVLFDRVDRRALIMLASAAAGVVMLLLAIVVAADQITVPITVGFALALGVAFGVNQPGIQAVVPSLVPRERLLSAVSLQTTGSTAGLALGAALGGAVIEVFGFGAVFLLQGALLLLSAALMLRVHVPSPSAEARARPFNMRREIADGVRFVLADRGLFALLVLMAATGLLMLGPVFALVPDVARTKLGQEAGRASLLLAATGVGMLLVSIVIAWIGRLRRMGLVFVVTMVTAGFFLIAMGLSEVYLITALVMFGWGVGGGFVVNTNRTLIQSRTPPEMMGRVMAFFSLGFGAARPLGQLLAAPLSAWLGSDGGLVLSGVLLIGVTTAFLVTQRELREME